MQFAVFFREHQQTSKETISLDSFFPHGGNRYVLREGFFPEVALTMHLWNLVESIWL